MNLNLLMGNFDWKGGMIAPAAFNYDGSSNDRQPYNLKKMSPKTGKPFGLSVIRHGTAYEESTIFAGYPARRNWWPLSSDIYQEILPSIADAIHTRSRSCSPTWGAHPMPFPPEMRALPP